jgi:CheY-like chemotaxis protein
MASWYSKMFGSKTLGSFESPLSRDMLIQAGRIVFIDDESPILIEELKKTGFSVDHDTTGNDLQKFDNQIYDVAVVDYAGVGTKLGASQGLDLLRHIKRVSPRTRLIAYTSRSLSSSESEFFRLSHVVLPKDYGLADSYALIEAELGKAFEKEHLFDALVQKLNVSNTGQRDEIQKALISALSSKDQRKFRDYLSSIAGGAVEKAVDLIITKLFLSIGSP